ncbi:MAG TPA: hypothetical protein VH331_13840 [Allosphingosinicella sp.]|jgi:hypothetical protein|nr:hypothetical protein [Allosphingosinicella sp.]
MIVALVLLFATPPRAACAPYAEGQRELKVGERDFAAKRYSSADRHYMRGLRIIKRLYGESLNPSKTIDDTGLEEANAYGERLHGHVKQAADASGTTLAARLDMIARAGLCR